MAARKNLKHNENARLKIKASQLVNRLVSHALSDTDIMSASQIKAAEILLRKVVPDLQSIQQEINASVREVSPEPEMTADEWSDKHCVEAAERATTCTD